MGVSGGAMSTIVLTLYGKPIHNAVATSSGVAVPITIAGAIGFILAGLPHQAQLPPLSLGFVSLIGLAVTAPVASFVAPYGAHLAHRLSRRTLEIAFGGFLLLVSLRFLVSLVWAEARAFLRIAAQQQPVAADFPALQPVEETHAKEAGLELARLRHQRVDRTLDQAADGDAVERDRRRTGAAVGGVDAGGIGEHFERQAGGFGVLAGQHDGAGAGVEHHGDPRAVDLRGDVEVAA